MEELKDYSDEKLLKLSRRGNQLAFTRLVDRYQHQVRKAAYSMLGDTPEAADVAQETFIRFYKNIAAFKAEAKLSTYLSRIAVNLSLNILKKQRRFNLTSLDQEADTWQIEDTSADPARSDLKESILLAVRQLDPDQQAAVTLHLIQGYTVKETAEILETPEGTISGRLVRATHRLRELLKDAI